MIKLLSAILRTVASLALTVIVYYADHRVSVLALLPFLCAFILMATVRREERSGKRPS